jgi:RecA/RadA recombinase
MAKLKVRSTENDVVTEMPKKKKVLVPFSPFEDIDKVLDNIEKQVDMTESTLNEAEGRMSTGLACLDLILGGGLAPGWYTNFGKEQTAKSTTAMTVLMSSLLQNVPIKYYFDFEGSSEPTYVENIANRLGAKFKATQIFGEKDNKGNWIIKPMIRYRSEAIAETFFNHLAALERKLPDKRFIGGEWWYIWNEKGNDGKTNKAIPEYAHKNYDKEYYRRTGKLRVSAPDGSLQALIVVDSYPGMLPESMDVDDPSNAMAVQARMFSNELKRVKGRMKGKRIAVVGVNQLRLNPGARFGNPEYEPGGEALKLYSDVRLRFSVRAISGIDEAKGKGQIEEEQSIAEGGGVDTYRYVNVKAIKNKLSSNTNHECHLRIWITDADNVAQGFDPVYDTYEFLKATGQVEGKREKMLLKLKGNEAEKYIKWSTFKTLILGDTKTMKKIYKFCKMKPVMLRKKVFKQITSGEALDMYYATRKRAAKAVKEKPVKADDDDE